MPRTVGQLTSSRILRKSGTNHTHCLNLSSDAEATEIYNLLSENYVEDDDSMFRFDYSVNFLRWALKPPDYLRHWHLGVRVKTNCKLVGFITGIPATIQAYENTVRMVEINFLCV